MKTKEELAKEYANRNFEHCHYTYTDDKRLTDFDKIKQSYTEGYVVGQPKWISINDQLPNDDRTVLVWVNNTENPQWDTYGLGSYIDGKWYLKGGRKNHKIVTDWCEIPTKK